MHKALRNLAIVMALLCSVAEARAQCSNQIVVYLDMSQSMLVDREGNGMSPFQQTLTALQRVLVTDSNPFLGDNDSVHLIPFSTHLETAIVTRGRAELQEGLRQAMDMASLDAGERSNTDLVAVLRDIRKMAAGSPGAHRRLFVVASDFHHDPKLGGGQSADVHWRAFFGSTKDELKSAFARKEGEVDPALLLFQAPVEISQGYSASEDLESVFPRDRFFHDIALGSTAKLEQALRAQLLTPIEVVPYRKRGEHFDGFQIVLTNTNCFPVEVAEVHFQSLGQEGERLGSPVREPASGGGLRLARIGAPGAQNQLEVPLSRLETPESTKSYELSVLDANGTRLDRPSTWAFLGNYLDYEPEVADGEWYLWGDNIVFVSMKLRGQIVDKGSKLHVRLKAGGEDVASGDFQVPTGLHPTIPLPVRLQFTLDNARLAKLVSKGSVTVHIDEAVEIPVKSSDVRMQDVQMEDVDRQPEQFTFTLPLLCTLLFLLFRYPRLLTPGILLGLAADMKEVSDHPLINWGLSLVLLPLSAVVLFFLQAVAGVRAWIDSSPWLKVLVPWLSALLVFLLASVLLFILLRFLVVGSIRRRREGKGLDRLRQEIRLPSDKLARKLDRIQRWERLVWLVPVGALLLTFGWVLQSKREEPNRPTVVVEEAATPAPSTR